MTDLEIVRKCAEKMRIRENSAGYLTDIDGSGGVSLSYPWNPLDDDAQAMAMVKKFGLTIHQSFVPARKIEVIDANYIHFSIRLDDDLNRAICELVAKLPE